MSKQRATASSWKHKPMPDARKELLLDRSLSDKYDVALVSYLIDTVLLGRFAPFPQPEQFSQDDHAKHQQHVMGKDAFDGG